MNCQGSSPCGITGAAAYFAPLGSGPQHLFILRSGAVDLHDERDLLQERCGEGANMGVTLLIEQRPAIYSLTATEDSLVLLMPTALFHSLCEREPVFRQYYLRRHHRVRAAVEAKQASTHGGAILKTRVRTVAGPIVSADPMDSVRDAVSRMAEATTSGLMILESGELTGIFTDHDLRIHVIAAGHPLSLPVARFMTESPVTVDADAFAFEAPTRSAASSPPSATK